MFAIKHRQQCCNQTTARLEKKRAELQAEQAKVDAIKSEITEYEGEIKALNKAISRLQG